MIIIIIAIKSSILSLERDDISLQFGRGGYVSSGSCFHLQNHRTSNASLDDAGIHHDLGCIHSLTLTTRSDNDERTRRDRRNFPVQDNLTHNRQSCKCTLAIQGKTGANTLKIAKYVWVQEASLYVLTRFTYLCPQ